MGAVRSREKNYVKNKETLSATLIETARTRDRATDIREKKAIHTENARDSVKNTDRDRSC